jgi:hypothetical protein
MISLAQEFGTNAIGVILSGGGTDGGLGVRAIKHAGGLTFAQYPGSARFPNIPINAIDSGCVDFVLRPNEIAHELARVSRQKERTPRGALRHIQITQPGLVPVSAGNRQFFGKTTASIAWMSVSADATVAIGVGEVKSVGHDMQGLTFDLDNDEIIGCHLVDCRILLRDKRLPISWDNCSQGCNFEFSSSALVIMPVLRGMLKIPLLQDLVLMELGLLPHQEPTLH